MLPRYSATEAVAGHTRLRDGNCAQRMDLQKRMQAISKILSQTVMRLWDRVASWASLDDQTKRAVGVARTVRVYDWSYNHFVIIKEFSDGNCCICLDAAESEVTLCDELVADGAPLSETHIDVHVSPAAG